MTIPFQIRVKNASVNFTGHPMLLRGLFTLCKIIHEVAGVVPVVTSMWDQRHSRESLHFIGCAVDVRSHYLTDEEKDEVLARASRKLGDEYDLILEGEGEPHEHFHLEWDKGKYDREASIRAAWGIA